MPEVKQQLPQAPQPLATNLRKPAKVCDFVYWFQTTDTSAAPQPMLVEEVHASGMIAGNIFRRGQLNFKATVQHRDSQVVRDNPKAVVRDGVYVTRPEYEEMKLMAQMEAEARANPVEKSAEKPPFDA